MKVGTEEIFLNSKTTSCIYDLISARQIATDMVIKFGMGKTLGITALNPHEFPSFSESIKECICKDIQQILVIAEKQARKILKKQQQKVKKIAEMLLHQRTLNKIDIEIIFK